MKADAIEIAVAPGVSSRGQLWAGDSLSLVLLHEPGEDRDLDLWRPLVPFLLGAGVTVIALDLRGHGASDGDWNPECAASDIVAIVAAVRGKGAERVVVCAAGDSAISALRAAELTRIEGLVLLSPLLQEGTPPRGAGEPKVLIRGGNDDTKATTDKLRPLIIGPSLFVTVPTTETGTALIAGDAAITCREHILAFLKEVRSQSSNGSAPDRFLELLGIRAKGQDT